MRKISLLVLTLLLSTLVVHSQNATPFTLSTNEGVTLKYTVLTEPSGNNNGTVSVSRNASTLNVTANDNTITATSLTIPATVQHTVNNEAKTYNVTKIAEFAFAHCETLQSVTIPNTVTTIGKCSFYYCTALKSIEIPASVTSINSFSFYWCPALESIRVAEGNQNYFSKINNVECNIILNKNASLLNGCKNSIIPTSLDSTVFNYTTIRIKQGAFSGHTGLKSITIPSSVTEIEGYAFAATGLEDITIPTSVTDFIQKRDGGPFVYCNDLKTVTFEKGSKLNNMARASFLNCPKLTTVDNFPKGITKLPAGTFYKCSALTSVTFDDNTSLTKIDSMAFAESGLITIKLPSKVTNIGVGVFQQCSKLTSITIPSEVDSIGNYAFNKCTNLTNITCLAPTPPTLTEDGSAFHFNGVTLNEITLNVPASAESAYSSTNVWNSMKIATPLMMKTDQWNFIAGTGENVNVLNTNLPADVNATASSYTIYSNANSTFYNAIDYKNCDIAALDFNYTTNNWNTTYLRVKDDDGNANTLTKGAGYFVWPFNENAKGTTITTANTITNLSNYLLTSGNVNLTTVANSGNESTGNGYWYAFGNPFNKDLNVATVLNTSHLSIGGSAVQGNMVYILVDSNWSELSTGSIPAGQGFMVASATQSQTATFNITYPTTSKSATVKNATDNEGIKFVVTANGYSKPMYAKQVSNAQDGFDINDAYILFSDDEQRVEPYFVVEGNAVKYNRYSSDVYECGVNFHALQDGEAKLSVADVPNGTVVSIINLATDEETVLGEGENFEINVEQGENAGKYKIKITKGALSIADVENISDVNVWNNKGNIHVSGKDLKTVEVLNTLGQSIYMQQVGGNEYNFNLDVEGSYIVRVKSQSGVKSQKLVITK